MSSLAARWAFGGTASGAVPSALTLALKDSTVSFKTPRRDAELIGQIVDSVCGNKTAARLFKERHRHTDTLFRLPRLFIKYERYLLLRVVDLDPVRLFTPVQSRFFGLPDEFPIICSGNTVEPTLPGLEPRLSAFAENAALQSLPDRFPDFLGFMRSDQRRLGADAVIVGNGSQTVKSQTELLVQPGKFIVALFAFGHCNRFFQAGSSRIRLSPAKAVASVAL